MTKDDLLKRFADASKPKPFPFEVESWDGMEVHLMPMSSDEVDDFFETSNNEDLRAIDVIIATVVEHLVDEDGERFLFYEDDEHREFIRSADNSGYHEIFDALQDRAVGKSQAMEGNLKDAKAKISRVRKRRR